MTFKVKLLITFIAYGLALVLFTQFITFKLSEKSIKSASMAKAVDVFEKKDKLFNLYIKDTNLKLLAINNSRIFQKYLNGESKLSEIESLFLAVASTSDNIMQLRYLDNSGMERVRVDRKSYSAESYLVKKEALQNKSDRYYFKEILNSEADKFWYSKIDLNVEHGEIEKPIKPVLRVGIPVIYKGEKAGIIIINIFMKNFFKELTDNIFTNIYIFDRDGYVMVDSVHKHCWNRYLEPDETLFTHFGGDDLAAILDQKRYYGKNIYAGSLSLDTGEKIHMIVQPKDEVIRNELSAIILELGLVLLLVIIISIPISYFFARILVKLKDKVDRQKEEQDVLLSLFDLSDAVLFKWENDENWSVNSVSASVEKLLGYKQGDFETNKIAYSGLIHSDDLAQVMQEVREAIESKVYFFEHQPYRVITKEKKIKWILDSTVIVRDSMGEIINFIAYLTDITELKDKEMLLEKLSKTDQLTQIANRVHLDDVLQTQHYRFNRSNEESSIILIDIDYFKHVNDEHGHLVGDKVLIDFARVLVESTRAGDTVGRWGGEEFLIVLPHTTLDEAMLLAEKLRVAINNNIFPTVKHKTASFGVSTLEDGVSIELLTDKADIALYKAKKDGRNRVCSYKDV